MSYGIEISATGALAAMHRQDALTGNLANLNTVGFKPVLAGAMHREPARVEDGLFNLPSDELLERLSAGVLAAPTMINFAQGPMEITDGPLDMAIQGSGFFVVGDPADPALTRDGRFTMVDGGRLVMASTGLPVLDVADRPIRLDPAGGAVTVDGAGVVSQGGEPVTQLKIAEVPDLDLLVKSGAGLFVDKYGAPLTLLTSTGTVRQGMVEGSSVNEIDALMQITNASRSAQSNIGMVDMQNRLLDRLVNTFARIA
jgi:flagellar basal body rod protein FlgG